MPTGKTDETGRIIFRRVQRTTGETDETVAKQVAISYERVAVLAGRKQLTQGAARRFLEEITAISGSSVADVEATDETLRRWVKTHAGQWSDETKVRYEGIVEDFLTWLGSGAKAPLVNVSAQTLANYRDFETAAGKRPVTVNKTLMVLAQAFSEPTHFGVFQKNPARGINVRGAARHKQKRQPFTFEQFRGLVEALAALPLDELPTPNVRNKYQQVSRKPPSTTAGDWHTLLLIYAYTGARQQEGAQLDWEQQVDLKNHRLTLKRTKNADEHWIPIHRTLHAHLTARAKRLFGDGKPSGFVVPSIARTRRRVVSNIFRRRIMPLAGIVQPFEKQKGERRTLAPYSLHSLRHSLSTWLQQAGVEETMRMQLIGHEDEDVNRGYTHSDFKARAAALAKVPGI